MTYPAPAMLLGIALVVVSSLQLALCGEFLNYKFTDPVVYAGSAGFPRAARRSVQEIRELQEDGVGERSSPSFERGTTSELEFEPPVSTSHLSAQEGGWESLEHSGRSKSRSLLRRLGTSTLAAATGDARDPPIVIPLANTRSSSTIVPFDGIDAQTVRTCGTGKYKMTNAYQSPADEGGCVGNGFIVHTVNFAIAVYNKTGGLVAGPIPAYEFFGIAPNTNTSDNITSKEVLARLVDPSCIYDKSTKRFYLSMFHRVFSPRNRWTRFKMFQNATDGSVINRATATVVAASSVGNPTKRWNTFLIPNRNDGIASLNDTAPPLNFSNPPLEGDYPQIGVDKYGVYVTTNIIKSGSGTQGHSIYALSKASLARRAHTTAKRWTVLREYDNDPKHRNRGNIFPVQATAERSSPYHTSHGGVMYFLSTVFYSDLSQLALFALVNTSSLRRGGARLLQAQVDVPMQEAPRNVPQKGSDLRLTTFRTGPSSSLSAVMLWNGRSVQLCSTWMACAGDACTDENGDDVEDRRGGASFACLTPVISRPNKSSPLAVSLTLDTYADVQIEGNSMVYPTIAMNSQRRGILAFTLTGKDFFPTAAFIRVTADGVVDSVYFTPGLGVAPLQDTNTVGGAARYGDYQAAGVDEKGSFWAIAQYVSGKYDVYNSSHLIVNGAFSNWATSIFTVQG